MSEHNLSPEEPAAPAPTVRRYELTMPIAGLPERPVLRLTLSLEANGGTTPEALHVAGLDEQGQRLGGAFTYADDPEAQALNDALALVLDHCARCGDLIDTVLALNLPCPDTGTSHQRTEQGGAHE